MQDKRAGGRLIKKKSPNGKKDRMNKRRKENHTSENIYRELKSEIILFP